MRSAIFKRESGFFRSSLCSGVAGAFAGGSVIATAIDQTNIDLRAALATLITAAAVAAADYLGRRKALRDHEANVSREHELTRAEFRRGRKSHPSRRREVKNNG